MVLILAILTVSLAKDKYVTGGSVTYQANGECRKFNRHKRIDCQRGGLKNNYVTSGSILMTASVDWNILIRAS